MEKIVNLQMPGSLPVTTQTRSAQSTDAADGFLTMLKQKQETPKDSLKTEEPAEPVKDTASEAKEEPKKTPVDDREPEEDVQQLALELAAQQAAVQNTVVTPDWQQPVQPEILTEAATVTEVVTATEVVSAELPVEEPEAFVPVPEISGMHAQEKTQAPVKAAESQVQQPADVVKETAKPQENSQEASAQNTDDRRNTEIPVPRSTEPVRTATVSEAAPKQEQISEETPQISYVPADQSQTVRPSEAFTPVNQTEGTILQSTVEELPQELGKALASGQTAGSQTLTVELEPAALGKLTIKVVYEAGRAAVSIMASNPKTLELLSEKASEIASILKERTGEETVIYTQQPQQQEPDHYEGHRGSSGQGEQKQQKEEERQQTESFAQQLRLGLV